MIMMMMIIVMNVCGLCEAVRTSICLAVRKLEQPHRPRVIKILGKVSTIAMFYKLLFTFKSR